MENYRTTIKLPTTELLTIDVDCTGSEHFQEHFAINYITFKCLGKSQIRKIRTGRIETQTQIEFNW